MRTQLRTILAILLLLLPLAVVTVTAQPIQQNFIFSHLDSGNGLSENTAKSITQDSWGFIWIGTKNGLNRYDGNSIKHYNVTDRNKKFGNQNISALNEDKNHKLWVGTDKGVFVFDPYTELFTLFDQKANNGQQIQNWISQIVNDNHGNIWIISPTEGAFRYNLASKKLYAYNLILRSSSHITAECICVRRNGDIWIGTNGYGLFKYNPANDHFTPVETISSTETLKGKDIYTMADYGNWIAIGEHEDKLVKFNPTTRQLLAIDAPDVHYKVIRSVIFDGKQLIVGTQDGLYFVNEATHSETCIKENDVIPYSLSTNMLYTLYRDRDNGIWVGTMQNGVDYLQRQGLIFSRYVPTGMPFSIKGKRIREMIDTPDGNVWIATEDGYLNIYHAKTHSFEAVSSNIYKGGANRLALMAIDGKVWSGLFKNGLDIIDMKSHQVTHYTPMQLHLANEGSVYALKKDHNGNIWLGTGNGLYKKNADMTFSKVKSAPYMFCQDINEDKRGNIWIATIGSGVFRYNPKTGKLKQYLHNDDDSTSISSNDVSSMTFDHKGRLWFSTDRGGICVYNASNDNFKTYSIKQGLPDDVAYKILEDKKHNLWFGTNHGLVCFNPDNGRVLVYQSKNKLYSSLYNYKAGAIASDGTFIFGGSGGIVTFNPLLAYSQDKHKQVYITNISVNNKEVLPEDGDVLATNIIHAKEIDLPYNFSSLSLSVSSLDYTGVESTNIEYKLDGVDQSWNTVPNGLGIYYSRLQPGKYKLHVRIAGDQASLKTLVINVHHPWWSTLLARIIYIIIILCVAGWILKNYQRRQARHYANRERRFKEAQNKELLEAKINFFTNITHEIRTPLTLINGSVENIDMEDIGNKTLQKNLLAIKKNCKRLLNLINQLLDFRKMDSKGMKLNFVRTDIYKLTKNLIDSFEPSIRQMNKTISLTSEEDSIVIPLDREAVTKILSNLLSNARKYSETFVQVIISKTQDGYISINVLNDGPKIPKDKAEEIFYPFTRLEGTETISGTGIGLPLARSLAELHNGTLTLDTESEYNSFILRLPEQQEHVIELNNNDKDIADDKEVLTTAAVEDYDIDNSHPKEYTLLIVEDNAEVLQMIVDNMQEQYNIVTATNGKEGLDKAKTEHIDLIISDVMMPVMDGEEMTRRIKDDIDINHIPIILLTAKQTMESQLDGLRAGADAYIVKPFSFVHLKTQVETLLANRKRERESFLHKPYLPVQSSKMSKTDEEFLNKISKIIIGNMRQPGFNVEKLAEEMCMSRSSLHRKIKELSDLTPIDFIRLIKLKKAAELIKEDGYRTVEVCEMVGISSPSYFIKLFQKQFGMTPKEFAAQDSKKGKK